MPEGEEKEYCCREGRGEEEEKGGSRIWCPNYTIWPRLLIELRHIALFGIDWDPPEAKEVTTSGFLASGLCNRSIWASFDTGFWRTEVYEPLLFWVKLNWDIKVVWNCKNVTASLYTSVPRQPRHIRRGKNEFLHYWYIKS